MIVKNLRDRHCPSIIFLMGIKMNNEKGMKLRRKCGMTHELYVEPRGLSGGLAVCWFDEITISVLYKSKNIIHSEVSARSLMVPHYITFVYGPPKEGERRVVWDN